MDILKSEGMNETIVLAPWGLNVLQIYSPHKELKIVGDTKQVAPLLI